MSLQRKLQRHCEWWATKPRSHTRKTAEQCCGTHRGRGGAEDHPVLMPLGDLRHPEALSSGEGRGVQDLQERALSQKTDFPGKRGGGQKLDLRFSIDSSIFNSFLTKGKEGKKNMD